MMRFPQLCSLCTLPALLVGCAQVDTLQHRPEKAWEYTEVACMAPDKSYPFPCGKGELRVLDLPESEYSKCLTFSDASGNKVPLMEGERTFGYAACCHEPQYIVLFDNYASRQNRVHVYRIKDKQPVLYYDGTREMENSIARNSWRVASWFESGILLEQQAESSAPCYHFLPVKK
ncbi:MAG: hypothetical protein IIV41_00225 [Akkermansia sp.]|nr:hypothetical protein [Akkermansia sp.]